METPTTFKGHPLHPLLIAFPIGLWVFSLISDIIYLAGWGGPSWADTAFYNLGGGIVFALIAAVPGLIDLLSIRDPGLRKIGIIHMTIMLITVVVFVIDFLLRLGGRFGTGPFILSIIGIILLLIGGWFGANLVHVFGITVEEKHAS
jgi:uncharacterized membrane protein